MILDDRAWILISEKLSGEISESDMEELEGILKKNPDVNVRMQLLESIFRASPLEFSDKKAAFIKHMQRLQQQNPDIQSKRLLDNLK